MFRSDKIYFYFAFYSMFLLTSFYVKGQTQQDTLFLNNNDRIVGEIQGLSDGILTIESEYGDDDFKITWLDIAVIRSTQYFLMTLSDGDRINGTLRTREGDTAKVTIFTFEGLQTVDLDKVVYLRPIQSDLISRWDASLSFGFNFTKSNNLKQVTIRSLIKYNAKKWSADASFNSISNTQDEGVSTRRTDANAGVVFYLKNDWFLGSNAEFLSNEEQQLDLRLALQGIVGKYIIHSNKVYLGAATGLVLNMENFSDDDNTRKESLEALIGARLNVFDLGDFKVYSNLSTYPSITESGRVRVDFKTDLQYDLPLDFFIKLGFTLNYDSQPVEEAAAQDYIFQATFGWEFN